MTTENKTADHDADPWSDFNASDTVPADGDALADHGPEHEAPVVTETDTADFPTGDGTDPFAALDNSNDHLHVIPNEDEDEDEDEDQDDSPETPSGDNKMSKGKTYAIMAGALVAVATLVGGGLYVKANRAAGAHRAEQAQAPLVAAPEEVVQPEVISMPSPPRTVPVTTPTTQPPGLKSSPSMLDKAPEANVPSTVATTDGGRTDEDGSSHVQLLSGTVKALEEEVVKQRKEIDDVKSMMEGIHKQLVHLREGQEQVAASIKEAAAAKPKQVAKPAVSSMRSSSPSTSANVKATAAASTAPPQRVRKAPPASSINTKFAVVATYPSTPNAGMAPERAWVTDGEKLVEVRVGSQIGGARVTKIVGTTVKTTAGDIGSER